MVLIILFLLFFPGLMLLPAAMPRRLRLPFTLFMSVAVTSLCGLSLLMCGYFSTIHILLMELPLLLVPLIRRRMPRLSLKGAALPLVGFLVLSTLFAVSVGEPFGAAGDAGVYTLSAFNLQKTGVWSRDMNSILPDEFPVELAVRTTRYAHPWREIAPGMIVDGDRVTPQFFPIYPLWGAIFASAFGIYGTLAANLLGALMLLLGLYILCRVFMPWLCFPPATLAALIISPVLWLFLTFPSAEFFLAGILLGWLAWTTLFLRWPRISTSLLPALLLSVAVGVKFYAWACFAVVGFFLLFLPWKRIVKALPILLIPLPVMLIDLYIAAPHLKNHMAQILSLGSFPMMTAAAAAILAGRLLFSRLKSVLPVISILILSLGFIYLYFIRPVPIETGSENNFVEFTLLVGRSFLLLAILGLFWFIGSMRRSWQLFLPFIYVCVSFYVLWGSGDTPLYPFAARRLLPLTLPLTAFFLLYFLSRFRKLGKGVVITLFLIAVLPPAFAHLSILTTRQGEGFMKTLEALENAIPPGEAGLATEEAWPYVSHLQMSGHPIFLLDPIDEDQLLTIHSFLGSGATLKILTGETWPLKSTATIESRETWIPPVRTPPLPAAQLFSRKYEVYEVTGSMLGMNDVLDVGGLDVLRVSGCYSPELAGGRSVRWTRDRSAFLIDGGSQVRFTWTPGANPESPLPVRVWCRGERVADLFLDPDWQVSHWIDLPESDGPLLLRVRTHAFQPAMHSECNDYRHLGIQIDKIEVR